jgi:hypothetical protein
MRVNLSARAISSEGSSEPQVSLLIRPACSIPGDYFCTRGSDWLLSLLRQKTDLPSTVLEKFENAMSSARGGQLPAVELDDQTLTELGYFTD